MSTETIRPFPQLFERDMSELDPFAQALRSDGRQLFSQSHGEGRRYALGGIYDEPQGYLEVFPKHGVVRYQGEGISIAGQFPEPPSIEADRLVFSSESEHETRSMIVTHQGEVTLFIAPRPPLAEPDELGRLIAASDQIEREISVIAKNAFPIEPIAADQPKPDESNSKTESNTKQEPEKAPRIEVEGRVGRDPRIRETAKGNLVAKFPIAEHPNGQDGETVWHTIVAFKQVAQNVSETVHKGDQVKVIGYVNAHEHDGKNYREINAVVIKPSKPQS